LTFAKGGYIIRIKPIAMGMFVVPTWNFPMNFSIPGIKYPSTTPRAIARKIHKVRNLSRKDNFLLAASVLIMHSFVWFNVYKCSAILPVATIDLSWLDTLGRQEPCQQFPHLLQYPCIDRVIDPTCIL